jgi:LacI family transcriptional regulator
LTEKTVNLYNSVRKELGLSSIKDVAREAGVSIATVSRVFSGRDPVSEQMRARVLAAAGRVAYRPNALARSLKVETTRTLGLVVPNIMNPFFTAVARAVESAAQKRGYTVTLGNTDEDPEREAAYLQTLLEKRVDGLLVCPARARSPQLGAVVGEGVPVVFLDRAVEGVEAPVIRADGRRALGSLVDYLTKLGHERLAIISGPPETVPGAERLEAFLEKAEERGVKVPEGFVKVGDFRRPSGKAAMEELLGLEMRPTAVFAANNLMALGAIQAVKEAGLKIPKDVSLASFDDVAWFSLLDPPLTAIAQPVEEMGAAAAEALLRMVEYKEQADSFVAEAELLVRGSCGPPGGLTSRAGLSPSSAGGREEGRLD